MIWLVSLSIIDTYQGGGTDLNDENDISHGVIEMIGKIQTKVSKRWRMLFIVGIFILFLGVALSIYGSSINPINPFVLCRNKIDREETVVPGESCGMGYSLPAYSSTHVAIKTTDALNITVTGHQGKLIYEGHTNKFDSIVREDFVGVGFSGANTNITCSINVSIVSSPIYYVGIILLLIGVFIIVSMVITRGKDIKIAIKSLLLKTLIPFRLAAKYPTHILLIGITLVIMSLILVGMINAGWFSDTETYGRERTSGGSGGGEDTNWYKFEAGDVIRGYFSAENSDVEFFICNDLDYIRYQNGEEVGRYYCHMRGVQKGAFELEIPWDFYEHDWEKRPITNYDYRGWVVFVWDSNETLNVHIQYTPKEVIQIKSTLEVFLVFGSIITVIGAIFYVRGKKEQPTLPKEPKNIPEENETFVSTAEVLYQLLEKSEVWLTKTKRYFLLAGLIAILIWYPVLISLVLQPFWQAAYGFGYVSIWDGILVGAVLSFLCSITIVWGYHYWRLSKEWTEWNKRIQILKQREREFIDKF